MIGSQNSRHFLNQPMGIQTKPMVFSPHAFSRAWRQLHVFASNSDWLVVLFTSVAIGESNDFVLTTLNWKPLHGHVSLVLATPQSFALFTFTHCLSR